MHLNRILRGSIVTVHTNVPFTKIIKYINTVSSEFVTTANGVSTRKKREIGERQLPISISKHFGKVVS